MVEQVENFDPHTLKTGETGMTIPPESDGMDDDDPRRQPRIDSSYQWEVFYHDAPAEPICHTDNVSTPSEDLMTGQTRMLFGGGDADLWLASADGFLRLGGNDLAAKGEEPTDGTEHGGVEHDDTGGTRGIENGVSTE